MTLNGNDLRTAVDRWTLEVIAERDRLRAEVERLRAENAELRRRAEWRETFVLKEEVSR